MSHAFKQNDFEKILKGRRSISEYDETVKISQQEMEEILRDAVRAPSSVNMQPWRFVVVESEAGKAKLNPLIRFNTMQNKTSSAMILIFGDRKCYEFGREIFESAVAAGSLPEDLKEQQLAEVIPYYKNLTRKQMTDVVKIDSSLVAMQLMLVARAHGYDTNPMGGFEADQLAEAFDLDPERYEPVMIVSIGKAKGKGHGSTRLPIRKVATWK